MTYLTIALIVALFVFFSDIGFRVFLIIIGLWFFGFWLVIILSDLRTEELLNRPWEVDKETWGGARLILLLWELTLFMTVWTIKTIKEKL